MSKRPHAAGRDRELTRVHRILSVRERQLAACIAALKGIVKFKSARGSVFTTEVEVLQHLALDALARATAIQTGKPLAVEDTAQTISRNRVRLGLLCSKRILNELYGPIEKRSDDGD